MITKINKNLNKQINHSIPSALVPYGLSAFFKTKEKNNEQCNN